MCHGYSFALAPLFAGSVLAQGGPPFRSDVLAHVSDWMSTLRQQLKSLALLFTVLVGMSIRLAVKVTCVITLAPGYRPTA
jgi:hypothetical protein